MIRGGYITGELRGSDKLNNIDTAKFNRNLHFKSSLYELSGIIEFNFFPYETGNLRYPFTPYIFTGISMFNFNPQARKFDTDTPFDNDGNQTNNEWIDLQPLGTEGQYSSQYPEKSFPISLFNSLFLLELGFKASLGEKFSMAIEYGFEKPLPIILMMLEVFMLVHNIYLWKMKMLLIFPIEVMHASKLYS